MNKVFKKAFSLFTTIFLFVTGLSAQQNHFVYVQTENKQPFYIKLDKKVLSSSASGYLIIPKLQDGSYVFTVGFPKNEWPEQNVTCSVNKKDAGYLLKSFGDKGWGFFNLQTMEVIMPGTAASDNKAVGDADKQDLFSNILSDVVNDPSIVKRIEEKRELRDTVKLVENDIKKEDSVKIIAAVIEKPEVNKTIEEKPAVKKEEPVIEKPEANKMVEDKPVVKKEEPVQEVVKEKETVSQPSIIKKLFSVKSSEGTDVVYADISNGQADTIRLFIPTEKKETVPVIEVPKKEEIKKEESKKEEVKIEEPVKEESKKEESKKEESKKEEVKKEEPKKEEVKKEEPVKEEPKKEEIKKEETKANAPKFIDIELANPNAKKDSATKMVQPVTTDEKKADEILATEKPKENVSKPVMANSDCKNFASEEDFLKLRKKMAAADNDEEMLTMSKKVFKSKCFTTEQVKNLSVLFLKDEGKYKFFDVAYPFVSDSYNFGTLEGQLTDNYFISRFKAMIHH